MSLSCIIEWIPKEGQMKKGFIIIGVFCFILFACSTKEPAQKQEGISGVQFQKLTLDEATELAAKQGKLVLIDFFSPS